MQRTMTAATADRKNGSIHCPEKQIAEAIKRSMAKVNLSIKAVREIRAARAKLEGGQL